MCKTQKPKSVSKLYQMTPMKVDINKAKWYLSIDNNDFIKNQKISISRKEPVWEPFIRDLDVGDVITFGTNGNIDYGAKINSCVTRIDRDGSIVFVRDISDITKIGNDTCLSPNNYITGIIETGAYLLCLDSPNYIHKTI